MTDKILTKTDYMNREHRFTVEEAVVDKLTPNAYSYETTKERLVGESELQRDMLAKLVTILYDKHVLKDRDLDELLGWGYEMKDK